MGRPTSVSGGGVSIFQIGAKVVQWPQYAAGSVAGETRAQGSQDPLLARLRNLGREPSSGSPLAICWHPHRRAAEHYRRAADALLPSRSRFATQACSLFGHGPDTPEGVG